MLLERLCNASGPVGYEGDVRNIIKEEIREYVDEIKVDRLGNIIAHKKGNGAKVILDAHMDEVGFIIIGYNDDGTLKFRALGGVNSKIILSKVVYIGKERLPGVIGGRPIHLQDSSLREKGLNYEDCCIDIGASSKEEAKDKVRLGEFAVFGTEFRKFGNGLISGKAFDDRVGCYVLIEALKESYDCDLYGVFNVQEEIGERGAYASSYLINPDIGIALEGTICADMPNIPAHKKATEIGKGPAISIMDSTSIFSSNIVDDILKVGDRESIPYQFRKAIAGGNDAGIIHMVGEGAKVATISVPCRYIHSAVSVASLSDIENTKKLLINYLKEIK